MKDPLEKVFKNAIVSEQVKLELTSHYVSEREAKMLIQIRPLFLPGYICKIIGTDNKVTEEIVRGIGNYEERRRVCYGHLSCANLPKEFKEEIKYIFGDWGPMSFYRGRWEIRDPDLTEDLGRIAMRHIYMGSTKLSKNLKKGLLEEQNKQSLKMTIDRIVNIYNNCSMD